MVTQSTTTVVLGKRKARSSEDKLSLRLESSPPPSSDFPTESETETGDSYKQISISAAHIRPSRVDRPYRCTYERCSKAYSKPSRLAEHERSHTGDRPFTCLECNKKYLRETHLQAHSRSHLPASARPFVCEESSCGKRFWTTQHLRVHSELHQGKKPFKCSELSCDASFLKHNQLREHICTTHAPPGTKPYRCEYPGCDKSFLTSQKLRGHAKTHDETRYTCVHAACLSARGASPTYFSTWTALQHHTRTAHPPTCGHPTCNGKTFKSHKGLRAHQKLHDQSHVEGIVGADSDAETDLDEPPKKRRRGGDVGRDWICDVGGCGKDFKSKKALTTHNKVTHLGRRDFVCPHDACGKSFGYKHLLQRHLSKLHRSDDTPLTRVDHEDDASSEEDSTLDRHLDIDHITGRAYAVRAQQNLASSRTLRCPHPDLRSLISTVAVAEHGQGQCEYVFTRAYDLRRHLRSEHNEEIEKDVVDNWVRLARDSKIMPRPSSSC